VERAKLNKAELAERLAGKAKERAASSAASHTGASTIPSEGTSRVPSPTSGSQRSQEGTAVAEPVEESLFGNMLEDTTASATTFSALDAPEKNSNDQIIRVRDMALPKAFTGKTPRSLLEDALRRVDKSAKVSYRLLTSSRAARAVVTIRGEGGRLQQFGMEDEACDNPDQAYHYVATLALHAISPDGSSHRLLPGPYRDLWNELDTRKKQSMAQSFEKEIAKHREIAKFRTSQSSQAVRLSLYLYHASSG
jgi:ATP-dependent RNA helicase DHX29